MMHYIAAVGRVPFAAEEKLARLFSLCGTHSHHFRACRRTLAPHWAPFLAPVLHALPPSSLRAFQSLLFVSRRSCQPRLKVLPQAWNCVWFSAPGSGSALSRLLSEPTLAATSSKPCPFGYYCPGGQSLPLNCPAGQFQDTAGQSSCKSCPGGYYCAQAFGSCACFAPPSPSFLGCIGTG